MPAPFYVDIHVHPSMRLFHHHEAHKSIWEENANQDLGTGLSRWARKMSAGVSKVSQTHFRRCMEGKVRVVFDSLYPLERGFVRFRRLPEMVIPRRIFETLVVTASGISSQRFHRNRQSDDYFGELLQQYQALCDQQGASPCGQYKYKIVGSHGELEEWLAEDEGHLAVVVTIEGAHVLGCGTPTDMKLPEDELRGQVLGNLKKIKAWEHPPFFVTFAHHFWNQLCGHSATLPGATRAMYNQNQGLNQGFTALGWEVLKELLSRENGKRILIDTRHMSVKARSEYYNYLKTYNREHPDDRIPIISSHSATNGFGSLEESQQSADTMAKKRHTPFCHWSLNISDEEMRIIHDTGGLIGVILDKGRHSGVKLLQSIDALDDPAQKKQALVKLLWDNMFALVAAVGAPSAWDILALGSDFDGVITHFDIYPDLGAIPQLERDLVAFLHETQHHKQLWFDMEPEELVEKFLHRNAMEFLRKHFH